VGLSDPVLVTIIAALVVLVVLAVRYAGRDRRLRRVRVGVFVERVRFDDDEHDDDDERVELEPADELEPRRSGDR
jgi:hypothetical protein